MRSNYKQITITLDDKKYLDWKSYLTNKLKENQSCLIKLNCKDLLLSCKDISSIIEISKKWNCKIIIFLSESPETIVSVQALGYRSHLILETCSNSSIEETDTDPSSFHTNFHQGTVRSGEYVESNGDLLILGDVNPGAMVKAEGNIMIWGRLLGTAHAGNKGNSKAKISALQLRPLQLRIATKVARGPQEKPQIGLAEQATIESESIVISPLKGI